MATTPQVSKQPGLPVDSEGNYILPKDHKLLGWTVDALLEEGKVEEARAELERLVLEGVDSGPAIEATPEFWAELRAELHRDHGITDD
jgi:hypothetical protein